MNRFAVILGMAIFVTGTAVAQVMPGNDAATGAEVRQPATAGASGEDACTQMRLEGKYLSDCRQEWMNAKTNAEKLAVRNEYADKGTAKASAGATVKSPSSSGPCDALKLKAPDLTQCRAQWETAQGKQARDDVIERYKKIAAGDPTGSRVQH